MARRLARLSHLPALVWNWWKALSALDQRDWEAAIRYLGALHARGLGDNDSHFRRGWALAMLERWNEAILEFEQISGGLDKPSMQACFVFDHCLALAHVGRFEEAGRMLAACRRMTWPPHVHDSVQQLDRYIRRQSTDPPRLVH